MTLAVGPWSFSVIGFPVKARAGPVEAIVSNVLSPRLWLVLPTSSTLARSFLLSFPSTTPRSPPRLFLRFPRPERFAAAPPVPLARYIQLEFNLVGLNARIYSPGPASWASALSTPSRPDGIYLLYANRYYLWCRTPIASRLPVPT